MTTQPSLWMQRVQTALEQLKVIPIWGLPLEFPWAALGEKLSHDLGIPSIEISPAKTEFLENDKALSGLGDSPHILNLSLSPLPGDIFWIFPRKEMAAFSGLLTSEEGKGLSDEAHAEGFYTFVALKTLETINEMQAFEDLRATLSAPADLPEEGGFALDLSIRVNQQTFWGRLLLPALTHSAFKNHFASRKADPFTEKTKALPLPLRLEVGSTTLKQNQLKSIARGDFVILDRCTFDPHTSKGTGILVLGSTPLFDVRLKGDETKILEYALFQEEPAMTDEIPSPEEGIQQEPLSQENAEGDTPLWSAKNGENGGVKDLIGKESIPMTLTVEVGKIQMPLEKVLQLEPGNVLELGMNPGLGVYLSSGGKRIAKGELIKLGENLGVKILSIGG